MPGQVNGFSVAYTVAGAVVMWSGIKGSSISDTFRSVLAGSTSPPVTEQIGTPDTSVAAVEAGTAPAYSSAGSSSAQQALSNAAAAYGWNTGAEWQALQSIELREAGFNASATNPSSGAYGLGQALGHGTGASTQGTVTNEYGGYGVSDAVAQAANSGDAEAQAIWMCAYIKITYGDPIKAWNHEQSAGWY